MSSDYLVKLKNLSPPKAVKIQNAPERIFLCLGDYSLEWRKENFGDLEEVTWCEDEASDITIPFVRADVHEETTKQLMALEDAIESLFEKGEGVHSDGRPLFTRKDYPKDFRFCIGAFIDRIIIAIQNSRARKQG